MNTPQIPYCHSSVMSYFVIGRSKTFIYFKSFSLAHFENARKNVTLYRFFLTRLHSGSGLQVIFAMVSMTQTALATTPEDENSHQNSFEVCKSSA
ncbi:hypothetical protein AC249_AIPGENE14828 [Exaiptasia diaphana]|nr:hypothetical protein AC249_AIPGENE14828 [Exaiptasia diaphana]